MSLKKIVLFSLLLINFSFAKSENKDITIQLSWFDQFQFAGYYIAKEKGFYKKLGFNVNIKPFEFGINIPKSVSDGKYDFAVGRETLMLDKANKKDIVALYALFQASPLILISTKESGINKITNFSNKRIMTTIDDASEVSIKSMITSQKVDLKNLNFIKHTHNIQDLVDKNTDVISAYTSKAPYHLNNMNIKYNVFAPKDYGFDMYSDLLYTSKDKITNDLDTVLKFKEASLKGWEYAYSNIEETASLIFEKYNSQNLTKEELIFEAKELKKLSYFETQNLGEIDLGKLQRIYDLYNIMGLIKNPIDIKDFVYIENNLAIFLEESLEKLSEFVKLPYVYFFLILLSTLILLIIYKQTVLYKTTKKLKDSQEELLKVNEELRELSEKDHLTKLYNRRYFESIVKEHLSLAHRMNCGTAVLLIDIDNFKKINDDFGHNTGDNVICFLADFMTKHKRASDVICRYGGEEFVILLPNTSIEGAEKYSEHLRAEIEKQTINIFDGHFINITVSMGLTVFKQREDMHTALDRADEGLYLSKRNGKNQLNIIKTI